MQPATAQLSIRAAIDSILTWTTFKINRSEPGGKMGRKSKDIFSVVMTPDRIPKFFIPSLDVEHGDMHDGSPELMDDVSLEKHFRKRQTSNGNRSFPETQRRTEGFCRKKSICKKSPLSPENVILISEELERATDHSDAATRAALSLPHLSKITTPYGFLTLGEIPNIRRKESLFFDNDTVDLHFLLAQRKKKNTVARSPSTPLNEMNPRSSCTGTPFSPLKTGRSASCEVISRSPPLSPFSLSSSSARGPEKSDKKRFQSLMRRHLSGIKRMRSNSVTIEKLPVLVGRTRSSPFA